MDIEDIQELDSMRHNISRAYTALEKKGANIPQNKNLENLKSTVESIPIQLTGSLVKVVDFDGFIIEETILQPNDIYTLPFAPTHDGLIFQAWTTCVPISNNTIVVPDVDITIGATYKTASGHSELTFMINKTTGLILSLEGLSPNSDTTISWGDGFIDTADITKTHTYSEYGEYIVTITNMETTDVLVGNSVTYRSLRGSIKDVRLGEDILQAGGYPSNLVTQTFRYGYGLQTITMPVGTRSSSSNSATFSFADCSNLKALIIPEGNPNSQGASTVVSTLSANYSLTALVFPRGVESFADGTTFSNCGNLDILYWGESFTGTTVPIMDGMAALRRFKVPTSVTTLSQNTFAYFGGTNLTLSADITIIPSHCFTHCADLAAITLPANLTTISTYAFSRCSALKELRLPNNVTSMAGMDYCYSLEKVIFSSNISSIASNTFQYDYSLKCLDFSNASNVPTLSGGINITLFSKDFKIIVPDSLYETWIAATNWASIATSIYKVSEV